jgi:hypothetical protein
MRRIKKISVTLICLIVLLVAWQWLENKDYFQPDYNDLTEEQRKTFTWQDGDTEMSLQERYRQHFSDKKYSFPRQIVRKVKLFENRAIFGQLTSKTLKVEQIDILIKFCNDTTNFNWSETTWQTNESEYYCKFYNDKNEVIGKMYFCLDKCGMTSSKPFCPTMKFGGLSEKGQKFIEQLIKYKQNWN